MSYSRFDGMMDHVVWEDALLRALNRLAREAIPVDPQIVELAVTPSESEEHAALFTRQLPGTRTILHRVCVPPDRRHWNPQHHHK